MDLPEIYKIKQIINHPFIADIDKEIRKEIKKIDLSKKEGKTVAITCGSRGITDYFSIVKSLADVLKENSMKPFIVPAMGSHGGGTAEGQKKLLHNLGLSEKELKIPIKSSMEVVKIGETDDVPVYIDKTAAEADFIVLFHIIKDHPDFYHNSYGTGFQKMLTIGLGKYKGADCYHRAIISHGFVKIINDVSKVVIEKTNILFALGVVQNAYGRTAKMEICEKDKITETEKKLFRLALKYTMKIPFDEFDILIIDEMGKEYSGAGFETKIVGRIGMPLLSREPKKPKIKRIVVCDITKKSEGNAIGIGNADFITKKLYDKIDFNSMYINAIAASEVEVARIPVVLENDRKAVETAMATIGNIESKNIKLVRIKNTKEMEYLYISKALLKEVNDLKRKTEIEIIKEDCMLLDEADTLAEF